VKELSPVQAGFVQINGKRRFCKIFDILQIIGLTGLDKGAETPTDVNEPVVPYASFALSYDAAASPVSS
jgi:hypothetical protein